MKLNKKLIYQWIMFLCSIAIAGFIFMQFCSCSPQYHEKQFIKKGGKIHCASDTVIINDTIKGVDGKDSIIEIRVPCNCPEMVPPITRWQIKHMDRIERKHWNDSLKHIEVIYHDSLKYAVKLSKQVTKQKKSDNKTKVKTEKSIKWYHWIFIILAWLISIVISFMIGKFLNTITYTHEQR